LGRLSQARNVGVTPQDLISQDKGYPCLTQKDDLSLGIFAFVIIIDFFEISINHIFICGALALMRVCCLCTVSALL